MDNVSEFFAEPTVAESSSALSLEPISGSGKGFCEIYRGDRDGKFRAFKCLKPEFRGNPLYERMLRKEFEIGYSLDHSNICEFYSFGEVEGLGNAIEMEWVDGCSLEALISRGKLKKEPAAKILSQVCDALDYLHSKQVIHRDLKPSNILITYSGSKVKLIDFGLSDTGWHSVMKTAAGTVKYAAPELEKGSEVDCRADIYSLGCIILDSTDAFSRVVSKCCQRDPQQRYSSALEVKEAINKSVSWNVVMFALFVALAVLGILLDRGGNRKADDNSTLASPDTVATEVAPKRDSVIIIREVVKEVAPAKSDESKGTEDLDDLFRQASDLFN